MNKIGNTMKRMFVFGCFALVWMLLTGFTDPYYVMYKAKLGIKQNSNTANFEYYYNLRKFITYIIDNDKSILKSPKSSSYVISRRSRYYNKYGRIGTVEDTDNGKAYFNNNGRLVGTKERLDENTSLYYNRHGNEVGRAISNGNETVYYNRGGYEVGSSEVNGRKTTYYDAFGRFMGGKKESRKNTIYYDRSGRMSGTAFRKGHKTYYFNREGKLVGVQKD